MLVVVCGHHNVPAAMDGEWHRHQQQLQGFT
jgi:hypothetical protein